VIFDGFEIWVVFFWMFMGDWHRIWGIWFVGVHLVAVGVVAGVRFGDFV
jgi:hypothetical protein